MKEASENRRTLGSPGGRMEFGEVWVSRSARLIPLAGLDGVTRPTGCGLPQAGGRQGRTRIRFAGHVSGLTKRCELQVELLDLLRSDVLEF